MTKEKIIYACDEHVEMAIDDFINEQNDEKAPSMEKCSDETCKYCNMAAEYKIS